MLLENLAWCLFAELSFLEELLAFDQHSMDFVFLHLQLSKTKPTLALCSGLSARGFLVLYVLCKLRTRLSAAFATGEGPVWAPSALFCTSSLAS